MTQPLSPKGAAVLTGIASLMFSATMFVAYSASHLWLFPALIAFYFGGTVWTLYLQLKNPASALLMMRAFVFPSAVMCILAWACTWALKGHDLRLLSDL